MPLCRFTTWSVSVALLRPVARVPHIPRQGDVFCISRIPGTQYLVVGSTQAGDIDILSVRVHAANEYPVWVVSKVSQQGRSAYKNRCVILNTLREY